MFVNKYFKGIVPEPDLSKMDELDTELEERTNKQITY